MNFHVDETILDFGFEILLICLVLRNGVDGMCINSYQFKVMLR